MEDGVRLQGALLRQSREGKLSFPYNDKTWVEDLVLPLFAGGPWAIYLPFLSLSFF